MNKLRGGAIVVVVSAAALGIARRTNRHRAELDRVVQVGHLAEVDHAVFQPNGRWLLTSDRRRPNRLVEETDFQPQTILWDRSNGPPVSKWRYGNSLVVETDAGRLIDDEDSFHERGAGTLIEAGELLAWFPPRLFAWLDGFLVAIGVVALGSLFWPFNRRRLQRAGNYDLLKIIAEREVTKVHLGRHRKTEQIAAIKIFQASPEDLLKLDGFCLEISALRQISSHYLPEFLETGKTAAGQPYFAMEWVTGKSLYDLVRTHGRWNDARTLRALIDLASGLESVHAAGYRHGDVQPSNALIQPLPMNAAEAELVRLIDFGLARPLAEASIRAEARRVLGTPAFSAPEVAKSAAQDHRSDLYSLGCLGYYLLTGQAPVHGRTPIEIYWKQIHEQPRPLEALVAEPIAPALSKLIHVCLSKTPDQRPASAIELAEQLAAIQPQSSWSTSEARAWWRQLDHR